MFGIYLYTIFFKTHFSLSMHLRNLHFLPCNTNFGNALNLCKMWRIILREISSLSQNGRTIGNFSQMVAKFATFLPCSCNFGKHLRNFLIKINFSFYEYNLYICNTSKDNSKGIFIFTIQTFSLNINIHLFFF